MTDPGSNEDFLFVQTAPPSELEDLVEEVWYASGTISYGSERILPSPTPILIINLGAGFEVQTCSDSHPVTRTNGWLVGPHREFMWQRPLAETHVVGAVLKPWGAAALFDLMAAEIQDKAVSLDAVWDRSVESLRDRLSETQGVSQKMRLLGESLTRRDDSGTSHATSHAANRLASAAPPTVSSVSEELGVSRKHLNALFDRHVGLPPKAYAQVHRLNRALSALSKPSPLPLSQIAVDAGYYDQAHMNRDFRNNAGVTPTAYLEIRSRHFEDGDDDSGLFIPGV